MWVFRYRYGGRPRELTLPGRYPETSLMMAHKLARRARAEVDLGIDVAAVRQEARTDAKNTVQALVEEWYAREIKPRHQHPSVVRLVLDNDILPALGRTQCAEVTPRQCDAVLRSIVDRGAPTTANKALRYMYRAFRYGSKRRYLEHNPVTDFTLDDAGGNRKPRTLALNKDELHALFKAMRETPNLGRRNELTFKILLATCVRKSELISARWDAIDFELRVWHLSDTKTRTAIDIPLAEPVPDWFQELRTFAAGSDYVLHTRLIVKRRAGRATDSRFPHISPGTLNIALKRVKHGLEHFTVYDMRRTARTHLAALGVPREVAERALNHKLPGIEGVYNVHDYFEERRHALSLWADLLVSLDCDDPSKMVPLCAG